MKTHLKYLRYPQFLWAKKIDKALRSLDLPSTTILLDGPCGDGIISFWLRRSDRKRSFELVDLDNNRVSLARNLAGFTQARVADVCSGVSTVSANNVWLLINSLYLLHNPEKIIESLRPQMKYIIAVYPDITASNYITFMRSNPSFDNCSAMSTTETVNFFKRLGYSPMHVEQLTHVPFYRVYGSPFWPLVSRLLCIIEPLTKYLFPAQYTLAIFKRS